MNALYDNSLVVKTHVARDLLQSAALFKNDRLVVWEYVSNGLQYVDIGTQPIVKVVLDSRNKRISVTDNGRGMDWRGLQNYFVMHGENIDRKTGKPGRGRFGTGKSAAFGIADMLRITTVQNGKKSSVELSRNDIEKTDSGEPIPLRTLAREQPVTEPNGTTIEIEGIHLKSLDQAGVIAYIERHLARWQGVTVFVNHHECEFNEPAVANEFIFSPVGDIQSKLGNVKLRVKVAKAPLDQDLRGIAIYANGVWYETTLAGSEGRDMSQYIFGEIDVPKLENDNSAIPPFDMSRDMHLNPSNEMVQAIYAFIGNHVDEVRRQLVAEDRKRRQTEEAKKLQKAADEIARIINEDFVTFRNKLAKVRAKAQGGSDLDKYSQSSSDILDDLVFGDEELAKVASENGAPGPGPNPEPGSNPPNLKPQVVKDDAATEKKGRAAGGEGTRPKPRGGFGVSFRNSGQESPRAQYESQARTIYINLDHPQVVVARGDAPTDDPTFRRLVNEIAFTEYAIGLAQELISRDEYIELSEPVVEIRDTINRLARKAAIQYSKTML